MDNGLVVVGCGPAGHSAAVAYRDAGGSGPVRVLGADLQPAYARPPLSKDFLRGEFDDADLPLEEGDFYVRRDIDVRTSSSVSTLDLAQQAVVTDDGTTYPYDACVFATGSAPARLLVPGGDHPDVLTLRSHTDAQRLRDRSRPADSAIVIGSGFIGCEAAVSLAMAGCQVTMLSSETAPQRSRLGAYAAERIRGWLAEHGVRQVFEASVTAIEDARAVVLEDDSSYSADLVLSTTGVTLQSQLAQAAGLAVEEGRVRADDELQTSDPFVWCAGDVVLADNATAGRALKVEHWGEALIMGEIAGHNAASTGASRKWAGVPGFWTEIGQRVLKYAAWGDGYDRAEPIDHEDGAFTVWYSRDGRCVGVLTHRADDDYDRGLTLVQHGAATPV